MVRQIIGDGSADLCLSRDEIVGEVYARQNGSVTPSVSGKEYAEPHVCFELYYSDGTFGATTYVCKYCGQEAASTDELAGVECGSFLPDPIDSALSR